MLLLDFLARFILTIIFILSIYGLLNNNLGGEGPEALQRRKDEDVESKEGEGRKALQNKGSKK